MIMDLELDNNLERKLTRVYVALAMTRDVAQRGVSSNSNPEASRSVLTLLSVASEMLEEILDRKFTYEVSAGSEVDAIEMVM
jgi:hypothetical protein